MPPAQQSIRQLISISISHQQIRQLCVQKPVRTEAQAQANSQPAYDQASAETVEILVEEQSRPKKPVRLSPPSRFTWALMIPWPTPEYRIILWRLRWAPMGTSNIFGHQLTVVGSNRRRLLNKKCRYTAISTGLQPTTVYQWSKHGH